MNDVMRMLNESGKTADELRLTPVNLAEILKLVDANTINNATAKKLLKKVEESGTAPGKIVEAEGLAQVSDDSAIRAVCAEVIAENPGEAEAYRGGKQGLIGWFVGQVMRKMRGKADPKLAREVLEELLGQ